jgi:hypothetical protein
LIDQVGVVLACAAVAGSRQVATIVARSRHRTRMNALSLPSESFGSIGGFAREMKR